jgi:2-polyprenyl-3-methyl-5-hydroxy-6-metoxy-1,4-benzoquinol methylase
MNSRKFDPSVKELMDLPQPVSPELERDLHNLETLNRLFGGHAIVRKVVTPHLRAGAHVEILDLATGAGDIPRLLASIAGQRGCSVQITAVDANASSLAVARSRVPSEIAERISFVHADVLSFEPAPPKQFDIVLCTLALHHFSREDAIHLLVRIKSLAHRLALVTDLRRTFAGRVGLYFLTATWLRNAMTRHDARLSIQRAWSFAEMAALLREANWPPGHCHVCCPITRQAAWLTA